MHSQAVDFACTRLVLEPQLRLVLGVSSSTNESPPRECVSVYSLDVERLLAYAYRFAPAANAPRPQAGSARLIQALVSLHPAGGALSRCCAASYGSRVVLFQAPDEMPSLGATLTKARSSWDAHPGAFVTSMLLSPSAPTLFSGANDGVIHTWDIRARPTAPVSVMAGHARNVTGLAFLHDACLASSGIDGKVGGLWALRFGRWGCWNCPALSSGWWLPAR
jgi:WD40 repeat protein